ncbi:MAG: dNTP triphosphohydrolase [Lachnospiraceae bacterium]|nr:dNTP triphosphohydrolase [Lachnospiraceae bacterium]
MEWSKLLSTETLTPRATAPSVWENYPIDDFEKDYREVVTSGIFRNLQNKAQVFSLVDSGIVRTRLTHSLEVSSVAKQLGVMVANNLRSGYEDYGFGEESVSYAQKFSMILACAGLLHDLGNPAFGHFGEASIGHFFKTCFEDDSLLYKDRPVGAILDEQMKRDLICFDGNAQTIHILLKSVAAKTGWNINVSYSVINTLVKYPGSSLEADKDNADIRRHKFGFYKSDEKLYRRIREQVGLDGVSRYPLTYLLEAADDISYLLSDMQDSISMNVITPTMVREEFIRQIEEMPINGDEEYEIKRMVAQKALNDLNSMLEGHDHIPSRVAAMDMWFNAVRDWLIYAAAHAWFENYESILNGTFTGELLDGSWHTFVIDMIRRLMKTYVYPSKTVIDQELRGHKLIENILERFIPAIMYFGDENEAYRPGQIDKRYLWYIPDHLKGEYMRKRTGDEAFDLYLRFIMIVDFVSSLTDSEAKKIGEMV